MPMWPLSPSSTARRGLFGLGLVLAVVVLAGVFALYAQPDFLVQMANQVWACF